MNKILTLCALFPLVAVAQPSDLIGVYKSKEARQFQLRINADNTVDALMATGTYTAKDKNISLQFGTGNSFRVVKTQGTTDQLTLTFKEADINMFDPRFLYIGYKNSKGEIVYESAYNKLQGQDDYTIEIPRTDNLYLVNAYGVAITGDKKAAVIIEEYLIGKNTSGVEITFDTENSVRNELQATYNPEKQTLTLNDKSLSSNPIVFSKVLAADAQALQPAATEKVKQWKYLIAFDEEKDIPEFNPEKKALSTLKQANSLSAALAAAKKNNRLVALLYQPNNKNATKEFKELFEWYEQNGETVLTDPYLFELYLATAKELKSLKAKGLTNEDQLIILTSEGEVIYHEPTTIAQVLADETLEYNHTGLLRTAAKASLADRVLSNSKAPLKEVVKVLTALSNYTQDPDVQLLLAARPKTGDAETDEDKQATIDYQLENLITYYKKPENLYRLRLTPEQLTAQWLRVVAAHKADTKLDTDFALLASLNVEINDNFFTKTFYLNYEPTTADLEAGAYLLRFFKDIKAHNDALKDIGDYTYIQRIDRGYIAFNTAAVERTLKACYDLDKATLPEVKKAYAEGIKNGALSSLDYIDFLYNQDLTTDAATAFDTYFKNLMATDSNLIAALDNDFTTNNPENSWRYYKMLFANRANNIAWKVYEDQPNNKALMAEAYRWAKAAVQLEPKSPYYLDTLAHLMFAHGDKKEAVATEEKAVSLLSQDEDGNAEQKEEIKKNLIKMKQGL